MELAFLFHLVWCVSIDCSGITCLIFVSGCDIAVCAVFSLFGGMLFGGLVLIGVCMVFFFVAGLGCLWDDWLRRC